MTVELFNLTGPRFLAFCALQDQVAAFDAPFCAFILGVIAIAVDRVVSVELHGAMERLSHLGGFFIAHFGFHGDGVEIPSAFDACRGKGKSEKADQKGRGWDEV